MPDHPAARTTAWFQKPVGRELLAAERGACRTALGELYGTFSALFGVGQAAAEMLDELDFSARHLFAVGEGNGLFHAPVHARPSQLPLASETLRLVVLQHVLETMRDPGEFIAECERVLAPGGTLAVLGLNPTGRQLRWRRDPPPWVRRWWSAGEIRQALLDHDFTIERSHPVLSSTYWWERMGRGREHRHEGQALGLLGSGYIVVFAKPQNGARVIPLGRATARRQAVAGVTPSVGAVSARGLRRERQPRRANAG